MNNQKKHMNVLMVGVDDKRISGMWTVAENYIKSKEYRKYVNLIYVAISTSGSRIRRFYKMVEGYIRIIHIINKKNIDLIHIHMSEKRSTYRKELIVLLGKVLGVKVVVQMHAGPIMNWYNALSVINKRIVKYILNSSDRMLVLGGYWKNQLEEIVDSSKIDVVYNGSECPNTNHYNSKGKYILFLGLLKKTKGIYDLIESISIIDKFLDQEIQFLLCGTDEEGDIQTIITNKGLNNRIKTQGWITKEKRIELLKETQICVLPSYFEALSMTVIEAMCYGIPVITMNISTMSELLGSDIEKITPGDIQNLAALLYKWINDEDMRTKISNQIYIRARQSFTVEKNIKDVISIYEQLCAI